MPWKLKGEGQVEISGQLAYWNSSLNVSYKTDRLKHPNLDRWAYFVIYTYIFSAMARPTLNPQQLQKLNSMWVESGGAKPAPGFDILDILDYLAETMDLAFLGKWLNESHDAALNAALQNPRP
jgi:hypothetical protein